MKFKLTFEKKELLAYLKINAGSLCYDPHPFQKNCASRCWGIDLCFIKENTKISYLECSVLDDDVIRNIDKKSTLKIFLIETKLIK